jgi:hypothetical protein
MGSPKTKTGHLRNAGAAKLKIGGEASSADRKSNDRVVDDLGAAHPPAPAGEVLLS